MKDKWGRRFYITAAVVLVLLGLVHSLSLLEKPVPGNEAERQLFTLLSNYQFKLMGSMRSINNLFRGFSISFLFSMIGLGVLNLLLARERSALLKRVAFVNALWLALLSAVSLRYFFILPTSFLAAALLFFMLAWLTLPGETNR